MGKRERNASYLQKYLFGTIKLTDSCPASQNLSENYLHVPVSQCETGIQVYKYCLYYLYLIVSKIKASD